MLNYRSHLLFQVFLSNKQYNTLHQVLVRVTGSVLDHDKPKVIRGKMSFILRTLQCSTIAASSLNTIPSKASIKAFIRLSKSGLVRRDFVSLLSFLVNPRTNSSFNPVISNQQGEWNQIKRSYSLAEQRHTFLPV